MEEEKKDRTDANDLVSPKNTRKLYKNKKLYQDEATPGAAETIEETLPEEFSGVDQEVGQNIYPSHSAYDPQDLKDI